MKTVRGTGQNSKDIYILSNKCPVIGQFPNHKMRPVTGIFL